MSDSSRAARARPASLLAYIADTECGTKESNHARDWSCSARSCNRYPPADAVGCCRQSLVCHLFSAGRRQRELRLCDARAVPGASVGTRRLVPPKSVSWHGVWDGWHLVIRAATTEAGLLRVLKAERVAALGVEVIGLLAIAVFSPVPDAKDVSPRPHRRGVSLSR
jgi:hypothetical protein